MGWEEGDVICGLVVVGDERVATGMMRVTCDAEPEDDRFEEEEQEEVVEAVSERELVTVTPAGRARRPALVADHELAPERLLEQRRARARPPSARR